jgi:hypothetical protein
MSIVTDVSEKNNASNFRVKLFNKSSSIEKKSEYAIQVWIMLIVSPCEWYIL